MIAPANDLVARLRQIAAACPTTNDVEPQWHQLVRRDAELEQPITPYGRALRASSRPWPGVGQVGECLCGSSLVFHAPDDFDLPSSTSVE